jgi:toxin CcdB
MSKFRVYEAVDRPGYILDIQADVLRLDLDTRVVVPLLPLSRAPRPAQVLNPVFTIAGVDHVMATQFIVTLRQRSIGAEVADLSPRYDEIVGAMDMLFHGF